jgi:hypothetical protein
MQIYSITAITMSVCLLGILSLGQLSDFDLNLSDILKKNSDIILIRKTTENKTQFKVFFLCFNIAK